MAAGGLSWVLSHGRMTGFSQTKSCGQGHPRGLALRASPPMVVLEQILRETAESNPQTPLNTQMPIMLGV
jgi:hypothetical protein